MCKLIKTLLIFLFFTANFAFAEDASPYILRSFDKCSIQNQCSDVIKSVKQIKKPVEANIMNLGDMVAPQKPVVTYKLPQAVYEYPQEHIYKKSTFDIDIIDPKVGETGVSSTYPGLRGANQLVLYTPTYGMKTGTNEFGAEVTVINNTVIKLSGADSLIPKDGFVISGHGKAKTWIQKNVLLGAKIFVDVDSMRIVSCITPDTYIYEANEKIKETSQVMQYYRMMDSSYDGRKASNYLFKASGLISKAKKNPEKTQPYLKEAKDFIDLALQNAIPYRKDEFRGVWLRPVEDSPKAIQKTVERLKSAGINNVFLETYFHGQTIYPSKVLDSYGVTSQRSEFVGFDPLKVWIDECHKNKIKVHTWFECFYVGNKPPRSSQKHILTVYPQWANTTKAMADSSEIAHSAAEHNGYFIDPANPEVQKFVSDIVSEIIEKYHPDGINLDYIRYPLCAQVRRDNSSGTEWGYTKFAREEFMSQNGADPVSIKVSDPLRKKWFEYRQNKITDFVANARTMTCNKGIMLTTVVFPDRARSIETKLQDWKTWSKKNLVDGFTPLLLTTDKRIAGNLIHEMKMDMNSNTKIYPGIFVMFMNAPADELLLQIHETRKMRSNGLILFDYAHLSDEYIDALTVRAFQPTRK